MFYRSALLATSSLFIVCVLPGCLAVGPAYEQPAVVVPENWADETSPALVTPERFSLQEWWAGFNDPVLTQLVQEARAQNRNLQVALLRVEEARAVRGQVGSQFFPKINATGTFLRSSDSQTLNPLGGGRVNNVYSSGFVASWEIDVFGRVRRSYEAAGYALDATQAAYHDFLVILDSEVALNYVDYQTFAERLRITRKNVEIQEQSLKLARDRLSAGLVPELDVFQAQANLATTRAAVPQLITQREQARNRLAVLLGTYPQQVEQMLTSASPGIPQPDARLGVGLPADLLRTRPDIRQAERELAAQVAEIGVARAELFPQFNVSGDLVLESAATRDFFEDDSKAWSLAPTFTWRLFSAGEVRNRIKQARAEAGQALAGYEGTVQNAVAEVESAMVAVTQQRSRLNSLEEASAAAQSSVGAVNDLYQQGLVNFQNLLDTERTLFQSQDATAESRGEVARAYIRLIKALGGGTDYGRLPGQGAPSTP